MKVNCEKQRYIKISDGLLVGSRGDMSSAIK